MTRVAETPEAEVEIAVDIDPVCGATIDPDAARDLDLAISFAEREYFFCGTACQTRFVRAPLSFAAAGRDAP